MKKTISKKITLESIVNSINDLAIATAKGFANVDKRFESIDERFDGIDVRIDNIDVRIDNMRKDLGGRIDSLDAKIGDLNFHKVRDDMFFLTKRVDKLEKVV
jgi:hypothetical protein